ncbi:hypothetical protein PYW08_008905 [Mythimna loreyi]|uniref:Uncharacterized protein n=1 Tax=Mythimna loreyi TaxID=667449 RepID=A0ACC2Q9P9_9NEOP|nr:hypothetical protein PYW08_008905 [Mythimna loreyi]
MNKENNRGAAGLRRSAIVERIRLREEWSALKEVDTAPSSQQTGRALQKKPTNSRNTPGVSSQKKQATKSSSQKKENPKATQPACDSLRGVVAMVDVGSETKALPLRCTLAALGATVVIDWSPLVTHLVWTDSGDRATRARARALACKLVSPLWVEACAASNRKLNERTFPAASRHSDLPSPRTLRQLLKKAEMENVPLIDLLSDSKEEDADGCPRLRISTETDNTTDTSRETIDMESRVNTAPRRAMAESSSRQPPKSRRKLFTHKEAEDIGSSDESDGETTRNKLHQSKLTQRERRDLARAERMAKKMLAACNAQCNNKVTIHATQTHLKPKIVLTGMSRPERQAITKSIQQLNGFIQKEVNKRTTHVLLGSCRSNTSCSNHPSNITGVATHCDLSKSGCWSDATDKRARTCNALLGAARGCRVLHARWALQSAAEGKWLHHNGFEVEHLRKICQKSRVERTALGRLHSEYAYDVFYGMRVHLKPNADQREAALQLLTLCGASVNNSNQTTGPFIRPTQVLGPNVRTTQTIGPSQQIATNDVYDVVVGSGVGEVNSKWVFDSVAAARMRTTRRYINMNMFS